MKKKGMSLLTLLTLLLLVGCAKVVKTTTESVTATILSTEYIPSRRQLLPAGSLLGVKTEAEKWNTTVEANGYTYTISDKEAYDMCKEIVGQEVVCTIITYYLDDATQYSKITSINGMN